MEKTTVAVQLTEENIYNYFKWQDVKSKIEPCLCRRGLNPDNVVTVPFLDTMEKYFRIAIKVTDEGVYSTKVTKELLDIWEISKAQLSLQANRNAKPGWRISMMDEFMMGLDIPRKINEKNVRKSFALGQIPMCFLSNENKFNGAAVMANSKLLQEIADAIESNLIICPSSIHEIIVVSEGIAELSEANAIVNEVNGAEVPPEERLSDHAYLYNRELDKIVW